jgi:hypothetical protein
VAVSPVLFFAHKFFLRCHSTRNPFVQTSAKRSSWIPPLHNSILAKIRARLLQISFSVADPCGTTAIEPKVAIYARLYL